MHTVSILQLGEREEEGRLTLFSYWINIKSIYKLARIQDTQADNTNRDRDRARYQDQHRDRDRNRDKDRDIVWFGDPNNRSSIP